MEDEITEEAYWSGGLKSIKWFLFALCFGIIGFCFSVAAIPKDPVEAYKREKEIARNLVKRYAKDHELLNKILAPPPSAQFTERHKLLKNVSIGLGILTLGMGIISLLKREYFYLGIFVISLGLWTIFWPLILQLLAGYFFVLLVTSSGGFFALFIILLIISALSGGLN